MLLGVQIIGVLFGLVMLYITFLHNKRKEFEKSQVNMQVLSTVPALFSYWAAAVECLSLSQFLNDHIAAVVQDFPSEFIGLGSIPMQNIDYSIQEMDRCINVLKFPGIILGSNINGENLSNEK